MTAAAIRVPERAIAPAASAAALVFGALIAVKPVAAVGLLGFAAVVLLAFRWPVFHLTLILAITAIVPYGIQNQYGLAGGSGLVLSDVLILIALLRAFMILARQPLERRRTVAMAGVGAMLLIAAIQAVRGWSYGADLGQVGYEFRVLFGWSTVVIAVHRVMTRAA